MVPALHSPVKEALSLLSQASFVHWRARTILMVQVIGVFLFFFPLFGYSVWLEWNSMLAEQREEVVLRANSLAARQTTLASSTRSLLISMSLTPAIRSGDSESVYSYFKQLGEIQHNYDGFAFFNMRGETVASIFQGKPRILPPESIREREYFKQALQDTGFNVSLPIFLEAGTILPMTLPIIDREGKKVGLLMAAVSLSQQAEEVQSIMSGATFSVKFFDSSYNEALSATDLKRHDEAMNYVSSQDLFSFFKENAYVYQEEKKITPSFFHFVVKKQHFVGSVAALQVNDNSPYLYIVVLADEIDFFDFISQRYAWQIIAVGVFVMLMLWLATFFGNWYFANGLERLAKVARDSRGGDLGIRVGAIPGCDEIQVLSVTFDAMLNELEAKTATLVELSQTDPLTGIWNRRHFMDVGDRECSLARRHQHPLTVVMADIDFFKKVNDTYGHAAGDDVLKTFSQTLLKNLRSTDLLARYGGEEFIVLLPDTDRKGAAQLVEHLRKAVEVSTSETSDGQIIRVTASFGAAVYLPELENLTLAELQSKADAALYESKANGRNRVTIA